MQSKLTSLTNPSWANLEKTQIDCEITTTQFGDEILPFTASINDVEQHGRDIFNAIASGEYGAIAEYIPPPVVEIIPRKSATIPVEIL